MKFLALLKALFYSPTARQLPVLNNFFYIKRLSHQQKSLAFTGSQGFTLIELVVFISAASIIISGILLPFVIGVRDFDKPDEALWAISLAQSVMEKYSHVSFSDSYLDITSNRGTSITDINFPNGYEGAKHIYYVDPGDPRLAESASETPYKKIEIIITTPSSQKVTLHGLVSDWSFIP